MKRHFISTSLKKGRCRKCQRKVLSAHVEGRKVQLAPTPTEPLPVGEAWVEYGGRLYACPSDLPGPCYVLHVCPTGQEASL